MAVTGRREKRHEREASDTSERYRKGHRRARADDEDKRLAGHDVKTPIRWNPHSRSALSAWESRGGIARCVKCWRRAYLPLLSDFGSPAFTVEESADQKFAADAAKDSMAEVELGKLALDKSNDARVREFAKQTLPILREHLVMARNMVET